MRDTLSQLSSPPPAPHDSGNRMPTLRKWYFAVNEAGLLKLRELLRAAVVSCRCNTSLEPHCVYVGEEQRALEELRQLGVKIIRHRPSLEPELRVAYGDRVETFIGHWLRLDLPSLETEDDFVLYTDIDVLFCSMPREVWAPKLLAAGPAIERFGRSSFNSGVLIMNLPALREVWEDFHGAVRRRLLGGNFTYPGHDQPSFNAFFRNDIEWLPEEMNWRPYWGYNPQAHIIHFHGPKPGWARTAMREPQKMKNPNKVLTDIWQQDKASYEKYLNLYETYAKGTAEANGARHPIRVKRRPDGAEGSEKLALPQFITHLRSRTKRAFSLLRRR